MLSPSDVLLGPAASVALVNAALVPDAAIDSEATSEVCRTWSPPEWCTPSLAEIKELCRTSRTIGAAVFPETLALVRVADGLVEEEDVERLLGKAPVLIGEVAFP